MLTKVSKRINEILQTQEHPHVVGTPKGKKELKMRDVFDRSRMSNADPVERANLSSGKERMPPRSNSKNGALPKTTQNLFSPAVKTEREFDSQSKRSAEKIPTTVTAPAQSSGQVLSAELFLNLYREQILAMIAPLIGELQSRIMRRLQRLEAELRAVSQVQRYMPPMNPTPIFNSASKPTEEKIVPQSQISAILSKAQLVSSKIQENQLRIVARFRDLQDQVQRVSRKAYEKCTCFNHLESLVQTQNYLCEQLKQLKHGHRRKPSS